MVPGSPSPEQRGSEGYPFWECVVLKLGVNSTFHHLHLLRGTGRSNFSVGYKLWNAPTIFSLTMNLVLPEVEPTTGEHSVSVPVRRLGPE